MAVYTGIAIRGAGSGGEWWWVVIRTSASRTISLARNGKLQPALNPVGSWCDQDHGERLLTVVISAVKPTITDWQTQQDIIGGGIPIRIGRTHTSPPREGLK